MMKGRSAVSTSATKAQTAKPPTDLQEHVRRRAFELYEQRGKQDRHDLDDWLQAESELVQQRAKVAAA